MTVAIEFADPGSVAIGNGVRLAKTYFPIESWPKSYECPFPTVKDDNYQVMCNILLLKKTQYGLNVF